MTINMAVFSPDIEDHDDLSSCIHFLMHTDASTPRRIKRMFRDVNSIRDPINKYGLQWGAGLIDSIKSSTPPSVETIKSWGIPNLNLDEVWVVYIILVEKTDEHGNTLTFIYIGSTVAKIGSTSRLNKYQKIIPSDLSTVDDSVSRRILAKLKEGFTITHILPVCATTIPIYWDVRGKNQMKAIIISVEAILTILFWTLDSSTAGSVTGLGL